MADIIISKIDSVYAQVSCEPGIAMELQEAFSFEVPGARFHPLVRNKIWDGRIRLYNVMKQLLYVGLLPHVHEFAKLRNYSVVNNISSPTEKVDLNSILKTIPCTKEIRDYQLEAIEAAINHSRLLLLSPTASGKSLILYILAQYHIARGRKVLIVVPTITLVYQMEKDFYDYLGSNNIKIKTVSGGVSKDIGNAEILISTWHSIYKESKAWFSKFDVVFGDEAHEFKAKSLTSIMEKLTVCDYRIGTTGTLDGSKTNKMVLEGLFGPVMQVTTTKKLMDEGHISQFKINAIVLKYSDEECKLMKKSTYQEEISYLISIQKRNTFIKKLALSLKGNTLILFGIIDHGKHLAKILQENSERNVHLIYGATEVEFREDIRAVVEKADNDIIVASFGTFARGVNITKLHNVIFAHPSKSKIRVLQSIGRSLRKNETKDIATLYDIIDNMQHKSHKNYTLKHFEERMKIFQTEKFGYEIHTYKLK